MLIDGSRVTPGTEGCKCDSGPLPDGSPRECEMPCWQRLGGDMPACCDDCAPLTPMCACGHEQCFHEGDGACWRSECECAAFAPAPVVPSEDK